MLSGPFPPDLAGVFIEGRYVLYVDAVTGENQEVSMKNRRTPGSLDNVEGEFCVFPDNLSGGIEADRSAGAEGYVGVLSIEDRCWGGESVLDMTRAGIRGCQDLDVVEELAAGAVDADRVKGEPFFFRAGQPDLVV